MPNFDPNTGALIPDTTTTTPGVSQDGVGGFLQGVGQTLTGSNNPFTNAALLPAFANAALQFRDAGKYTDLGNTAANRADPFGNNNNRQQYIDQLSALEKDPSKIADTPGYKFALNQALDATGSRLASQGYLGSSQMQSALTAQSSGLAQQTYNSTIDQLSKLSGAQFDPANAAAMQMKGGQLSMEAESNALNAMMYPFGPKAGGTTVNNNNTGGNGGNGGPGGRNGPGGGGNPFNPGQGGPGGVIPGAGNVANLWAYYQQHGTDGMDPSDVQILRDSGLINPANDPGGVDVGTNPSDFGPPIGDDGTGNFTDINGNFNSPQFTPSTPLDTGTFSANDLWG